jgi:hypothetical protein
MMKLTTWPSTMNRTMAATTTAPTLMRFTSAPLSLRAASIIVVLAERRVGCRAESGKTQGEP